MPNVRHRGDHLLVGGPHSDRDRTGGERRRVKNLYFAAFGRFAPYFERDCLRSFTPWVSSEPRTMW